MRHPLQHGAPLWSAARLAYLALLAAYWLWNLAHLAADLKGLAEVSCCRRLGRATGISADGHADRRR